jgi:peptidoglycan/LPS O-acetylase OafA/YrhL
MSMARVRRRIEISAVSLAVGAGNPAASFALRARFANDFASLSTGTLPALARGTMLRLNRKQRTAVSESVRQIGTLTFGALVLGQFVASRPSWSLLLLGAASWIMLTLVGILLLAGEES